MQRIQSVCCEQLGVFGRVPRSTREQIHCEVNFCATQYCLKLTDKGNIMFRKKAKAKSLAEPSSSKLSAVNQRGRASCPFLQDRRKPTKSIMKYVTADESLHKKYEETRRNSNASLQFSEIEIREYSRTVGDNPSCSSGPPLS